MKYEEFKQRLVEDLNKEEEIAKEYQEIKVETKNGSEIIEFRNKIGIKVSQIAIKGFYKDLSNVREVVDERYESILKRLIEHLTELKITNEEIDNMKEENIIMRMVRKQQIIDWEIDTEEFLCREFLNTYVIYIYAKQNENDDELETMQITKEIADIKGWTEEQLYEVAMKNIEEKFKPEIKVINDDILVEGVSAGASILNDKLLQELVEKAKGNIYLSTTDEGYIVRATENTNLNNMKFAGILANLVEGRGVNESTVYHYDAEEHKVTIA